ncbi:MAG: molybdopterin-dependent oxidoreductase [Chloroflexi bacterium]|nr:molybdopterin-dependent oxidoreductase [Chloroflexota bacterium]
MDKIAISLIVNGRPVSAYVSPNTTLLTFLRGELQLTGTKNGCAQGHCGTCTVIVDGEAVRSCLLKMSRLNGKRVETIEGLSRGDELHPIQQSFVNCGAVQCGFCTPGMIMSAKALLDRCPDPTEEEIKQALARNLCRCTGYVKIIEAVQEAARMLRGEKKPAGIELPPDSRVVGRPVPRIDAIPKVKGETKYADDLTIDHVLYARALRSQYPHAEIISIDTREAERVPGVVAVLTAKDVPGRNAFGLLIPDQPVLADKKVRYVGDALALVLAESQTVAEAALERTKVEYRPLEVVSTPQRALEPDAPLIHESGNVLAHIKVRKGDVAKGFAQADVIVEQAYFTPFIDHAYLEPEAGLAAPNEDGGVTIWVGSQGPGDDRRQVAASLALPEEKVRIIHLPTGGAFGGREDVTVQILCALGALHTKRPVKMVFSRLESLRVRIKRHAEYLRYKTGMTRDGKLVAAEVEIIGDTGAYASAGEAVLFRSAEFACGPYVIPNVKVDAYAVYTNNVPCGAMRGFGCPEPAFASEAHMDLIARRLGMDPLNLRQINALDVGRATITGDRLEHGVGLRETISRVQEALTTTSIQAEPGKKVGVGIACAYKNVGLGSGMEDAGGAIIELTDEGRVLLRVGAVDLGQGSDTVLAQIAAQTIGMGYDHMIVQAGDTKEAPEGGMTTASRQTFVAGNAVLRAAERFKEQLVSFVADEFQLDPSRIIIQGGHFIDQGEGRLLLSWKDLSALAQTRGWRLRAEHRYVAPQTYPLPESADLPVGGDPEKYRLHFSYCFATHVAIVAVDESSGEVEVMKVIAAHDAGKVINPHGAEGQIEGGVVMGMGYALSEEFKLDNGRVITDTLAKCRLPTIRQTPEITPILVEDYHPFGPYGAKGMGELAVAPAAPAIINAIYDAVGVRITELPATKEKIRQALNPKVEVV